MVNSLATEVTIKNNYGFPNAVAIAAVDDLSVLEDMIARILDIGPLTVSWSETDRSAPMKDINGRYSPGGFASVDEALSTYLWRIQGMKSMIVTDTDCLLTNDEKDKRDKAMKHFLARAEEVYITNKQ